MYQTLNDKGKLNESDNQRIKAGLKVMFKEINQQRTFYVNKKRIDHVNWFQ